MAESTSADDFDPFLLLVHRRGEAEDAGAEPKKARADALTEATNLLFPFIWDCLKSPRFKKYRDVDVRQEAGLRAYESLFRRCEKIYDGVSDPPTAWKGFVATTVEHKIFDILRGQPSYDSLDVEDPTTGIPIGESVRADGSRDRSWSDGGVGQAAMSRAGVDALLRQVRQLQADLESGELVCLFHPGRRCPHVRTGRIGRTCRHREEVFQEIVRMLLSDIPESISVLLLARTGYDGHRGGNQFRRNVRSCLDWFTYLMFRGASGPFVGSPNLLRKLEKRVVDHLTGVGPDAPSATTICILINSYPRFPIPEQLFREFGPTHSDRSQGESR